MLQVERKEGVWALGDCASIPDGNGGFHPPTAQHALRQARTVARDLVATIRGEALKPIFVQNDRWAGRNWTQDGRRPALRSTFLRFYRLVDVEDYLSQQTAGAGKASSCGFGLDSRSRLCKRYGPVHVLSCILTIHSVAANP